MCVRVGHTIFVEKSKKNSGTKNCSSIHLQLHFPNLLLGTGQVDIRLILSKNRKKNLSTYATITYRYLLKSVTQLLVCWRFSDFHVQFCWTQYDNNEISSPKDHHGKSEKNSNLRLVYQCICARARRIKHIVISFKGRPTGSPWKLNTICMLTFKMLQNSFWSLLRS